MTHPVDHAGDDHGAAPAAGTDAAAARADAGFARLHADAVAVLTSWVAPDATQEALRQDYLTHLAAHVDGVRRDGPPAHLTASTLVVDADRTHLLLVLHGKARRWFQPGGHLEADDLRLAAAAEREAREETGIAELTVHPGPVQLDRHDLDAAFGRCRTHLDVRYLAVAPPAARATRSDESLDVRWWPLDALPDSAPRGVEHILADLGRETTTRRRRP